MSHSFRYPADTLTQVGDERNRSFAARRVAQEHRGLDRSSQRTPVMVRHLPHRPYTQPLQSSWNGVRAPSTYIQSSPDDGAKDSTIVGLTSNAPGHSSAHPQRPHIETSLPAKWSSERILSAACSRPLPLPFLPNRQSLAGMPLLPEDYPQCSLNRPSKPIKEYIYALIDGNHLVPHSDFVRRGYTGGYRAARMLHVGIRKYLNLRISDLDAGLDIVTHIYFDTETVMQLFSLEKEPPTLEQFKGFCGGLRSYHEHTAYEDIGQSEPHYLGGKNQACPARDRVGWMLITTAAENVFEAIMTPGCRRVVFAWPTFGAFRDLINELTREHAKGRFLDKFQDKIWDKIDPFFPAEDVFFQARLQPLRQIPIPSMSLDTLHAPHRTQQPSVTLEWRRPSEDSTLPPKSTSPAVSVGVNPAYIEGDILRNKNGQRIDAPIPYSRSVRDLLAQRKPRLCNVHHLRGPCPYIDCNYSHEPLIEAEKNALRVLAREQPCKRGNECEDATCFAGHHCLRTRKCPDSCRFGAKAHVNGMDMHVGDWRIVGHDRWRART